MTVTLPEARSIGEEAFFACALETLRIPSVTYIGNRALKNQDTASSDGLFLYLGSTPPNLGTGIVNGGSSVNDRINILIPNSPNVTSSTGYDFSGYSIPTGPITNTNGTVTDGGGTLMSPSLCSIDYYTP